MCLAAGSFAAHAKHIILSRRFYKISYEYAYTYVGSLNIRYNIFLRHAGLAFKKIHKKYERIILLYMYTHVRMLI